MKELFVSEKAKKLQQLEEKLRRQKLNLAEARRKRDVHCKCVVAGRIFEIYNVGDISQQLDSKEDCDKFINIFLSVLKPLTSSENKQNIRDILIRELSK